MTYLHMWEDLPIHTLPISMDTNFRTYDSTKNIFTQVYIYFIDIHIDIQLYICIIISMNTHLMSVFPQVSNYICISMHGYSFISVFTWVLFYVCISMGTHLYLFLHGYSFIYVSPWVLIYICFSTGTHLYIYISMGTHLYLFFHGYSFIYIYFHGYSFIYVFPWVGTHLFLFFHGYSFIYVSLWVSVRKYVWKNI